MTTLNNPPNNENPLVDAIAKGIILIALVFAGILHSSGCFGQCQITHESSFAEYFEDSDYHCYKSRIGNEYFYDWDITGDGVVSVIDHMILLQYFGGQILTQDLAVELNQFGTSGGEIQSPNICALSVNTVQSSGVTMFLIPENEPDFFMGREVYYPGTTDDAIIQYTQNDEGSNWPECLSNLELSCLNTFKMLIFMADSPEAPFANIIEEYYFIKK